MGRPRSWIIEGFLYYLKSFLLARPRRRTMERLVKRVAMKKLCEFKPWSVFLVYSIDTGALLVHGSRHYVYAWRYEKKCVELLRCLMSKLKRGLFIDVGAYVGFYTILAAKSGWRVLAFEPNPLNLLLLKHNISLHDVGGNVIVFDKGVGDVQQYAKLTISSSPSESSFTKYLGGSLRMMDVIVELTTLDSIVESLDVGGDVSIVMKIDVEGFGLNVVKGAIKTIKRFRPWILFEVHRTFDEADEVRALNILKSLDYKYDVVEPRSAKNFIVYAYPGEKRICLP